MPAYGLAGVVVVCGSGVFFQGIANLQARQLRIGVRSWRELGADMAALTSSVASLTITPLSAGASSRSTACVNRGASLLRIECSSHPQKKATAHHNKSRPKKHNPYDKNRQGPTLYKRLPKPPPIWGFDTSDLDQTDGAGAPTESSATAA